MKGKDIGVFDPVAKAVHIFEYRIFALALAYYIYPAYLGTFVRNKYSVVTADNDGDIGKLIVEPSRHFRYERYGGRSRGKPYDIGLKALYLLYELIVFRHIELMIELDVMTAALYDSGNGREPFTVVTELVFTVLVLFKKVGIYQKKSLLFSHFVLLSELSYKQNIFILF